MSVLVSIKNLVYILIEMVSDLLLPRHVNAGDSIWGFDPWIKKFHWSRKWQPVPVFYSIQSLSHVLLFATPWTAACQASLSFTISQNLLKLLPIKSVMPSNHLIFCCPLLLLPSIFPSIRIFSNKLALPIRCHIKKLLYDVHTLILRCTNFVFISLSFYSCIYPFNHHKVRSKTVDLRKFLHISFQSILLLS